ncbi:MAG: type 2 isopentenyl-diphosphate Delta-isomerase [Candidatus Parcubacteria bacterium]|uniref:type 2 isopentenyl-diphosphate Delta-isomerase n=1 Tax=Phormidesmis priestleyi TaxID=268141 RepID=UPI00083A21FE|nr:type 2 isopentenyl-diphosphate Delta-isomerase [Phormidesmis priestleyi]MBC7823051.1 type 2 isopentenyl-diphosphate Delta-isomerase [Leptolyngbyaceae cyanobacterium LF-bin-113]
MNSFADTQIRKADHLRICLDEQVQCRDVTNGLEHYRFVHNCLPDLDRDDINLSTSFLGKKLGAPILISSMTGGTEIAKQINQRLATIAQHYKLAMGVGSQRVAVENPQVADTFAMRAIAPDAVLFANLGAVQLNYRYGIDECLRVIEQLEADALILHLNPLQECVQTKGDTNFRGLLEKIAGLCDKLSVPVIVKEVGNGISAPIAQKLIAAGVAAIDVAGAGGTSWAKVESERATDDKQRRLGATFADWGIPTAECIVAVRSISPDVPLIASGGLRNGLEIAKTIALGADLAGLAFPFLQAANESEEAAHALADVLIAEITTVLFCTGNATLADLKRSGTLKAV